MENLKDLLRNATYVIARNGNIYCIRKSKTTNMSKMKIIFGWKLTETYLCGKFVELEIIREKTGKVPVFFYHIN